MTTMTESEVDTDTDTVKEYALRITESFGKVKDSDRAKIMAAMVLVAGSMLGRCFHPSQWDGLAVTFQNQMLEIAHDFNKRRRRKRA